ncbi:MAG: hypothetical protein KAS32_09310 [Candidatus Peribacteraceae bacterium]|nr:hypothetical protein [Candidatus Peribacteraceae bacterium]
MKTKSKIFTDLEFDVLDKRFNSKAGCPSLFGTRVRPKLIEMLDVWFPKLDKIRAMIDESYTTGYTHEHVLEMFNRKKNELGRKPTLKELDISQSAFKRYGGYNRFLLEIGEEPYR